MQTRDMPFFRDSSFYEHFLAYELSCVSSEGHEKFPQIPPVSESLKKDPVNKSPVSHASSAYRCYLPVLAGLGGGA